MTFQEWRSTRKRTANISEVLPELCIDSPAHVYGKDGQAGYIFENEDRTYELHLPMQEIQSTDLLVLEEKLYEFIAGENGWDKSAVTLIWAGIEGRRFDIDTFAATRKEARALLIAAWKKMASRGECGTFHEDDIVFREIKAGTVLLDGEEYSV